MFKLTVLGTVTLLVLGRRGMVAGPNELEQLGREIANSRIRAIESQLGSAT